MKRFFCIIVLIIPIVFGYTQDGRLINSYIENIVEQTVSNDENADIESIVSDLEFLYRNPLNINNVSASDLEKLWILNDFQVNAILEYRNKMSQIVSIHELRYIYGFNNKLVDLITPFIICGTTEKPQKRSFAEHLRRSNHEILLRATYKNNTDDNYLGSPLQQYTRYTASFSDLLKIGLIAEKDAGEQFATGINNAGYDFYSGHVNISTMSVLKSLTLGDYRVRLGQGLLLWNGYTSGKSSEITSTQKRGQGVTPNTSKDEYNFLRGAATTIGSKGIILSMWGSYKQLDGSIDSIDNKPVLRNINTSGYHRTQNEVSRKYNIEEITYGASLSYKSSKAGIGINWLHTEYSLPINPESLPHKQHAFKGKNFDGFSADYKVLFQKTQLYGELAYANDNIAGITGLNLMPHSRFTGSLFYRYYQRGYFSPYANGMVESGDLNNEQGLFGGIKWHTDWKLTLSAYADVFAIPWISYSSHAPARGVDYLAEMNYSPLRDFELTVRYKFKKKEKNYKPEGGNIYEIQPFQKQGLRINAWYNLTDKLRMASRIEWSESGYTDYSRSTGHLLFQDISYHLSSGSSFYFRYSRFHIEEYDSRIYAYENDVLYAYSMPGYYGKGQKIYFMIRQKFGKAITIWLRYANTNSFNNSFNNKNEFRVQLMFKF